MKALNSSSQSGTAPGSQKARHWISVAVAVRTTAAVLATSNSSGSSPGPRSASHSQQGMARPAEMAIEPALDDRLGDIADAAAEEHSQPKGPGDDAHEEGEIGALP